MTRRFTLIAMWAIGMLAAWGTPDISWLETVHDYGAIDEENGPAECKLRFVNRGTEPVAIVSARASCGCTTPRYDTAPVAPGDTAEVSVTYDPVGRPGRFAKRVRIETSDGHGDHLKSNLEIRGVVVGASNTLRSRYPIEAGPINLRSSTAAFGEVKKGSYKSVYVEVYNHTADTLHPYFGSLPPYLNVTMISPIVPPAEQMTYVISLNSAKLPVYGIFNDSISLYPGPGHEPVAIDLVAIIREDFSKLTPAQLSSAPAAHLPEQNVDFKTLERGSTAPLTATFDIINRGKSPLLLRRVYTTDPGVTVLAYPDKIKKGKKGTVTVQVNPSEIRGDLLNARIQVITNDPDRPVQTIRAVGQFTDF